MTSISDLEKSLQEAMRMHNQLVAPHAAFIRSIEKTTGLQDALRRAQEQVQMREAILGKLGPDLSALARPAFEASRSIGRMFDPLLIDKSVALFAAQTAKAAHLGVGLDSVNKAIFATDWLRQFKLSSIEQNASLVVQAHLTRLYERSALAENALARVRGESIGTKLAVEPGERVALRTSHDAFGIEYREFFGHVKGSDIGVLEVPASLTELPAEEFVNQSSLVVSTSESEVDEESAEAEREVTNEYTTETSDALTTLVAVFNPELVHLLNGAREAFNSRHSDYVRHFVTSYRELFTHLLHSLAPDENVRAWTKDSSHFSNNRPTRRARLLYITRELGPLFGGFMSADVDTVLEFINVFQKGTHGIRPQFTDEQLLVMKTRTEGLLRFMLTVYQVTNAVR